MYAKDVMTPHVVSVRPDGSVSVAARLMLQKKISGLPVVNDLESIVCVVSGSDFLRRTEIGTKRQRSRWVEFFMGPGRLADEWRAVLSIWPWCSTGSAAGCCRGDCRHDGSSILRRNAGGRVSSLRLAGRLQHRQGSWFTGQAFTGVLGSNGITISMDGKSAWRDKVFVERLWRSIKYEEVYLRAYDSVSHARASPGHYLDFYNSRRPYSSLHGMTPDQVLP
jgi:CBS domain/Integrase core domain